MRNFVILSALFLTLTACDTLQGGLGVAFGPGGTSVSPSLSGTSGNATISIGG